MKLNRFKTNQIKNSVKLPMTNQEKKYLAIAGLITIILAGIVIMVIIVRRIKNRERYSLIINAESDQLFWKGKTELDSAVSKYLVKIWKLAGITFSENQMQKSSTHNTYPWSAAYVSYLLVRSGYNFKPRTTHAAYVVDAKKARSEKLKNRFYAFKPSENKQVEIGDILVVNRGGNYNLDNITPIVPTHGDVVIYIKKKDGKNYAVVQGGNVSNTVKTKYIELTENKTIPKNSSIFAHLKYVK